MDTYILTNFDGGNSNKVWKIEIIGNIVKTHFGRVGLALQTSEKSFVNNHSAQYFANKKIKEKTEKGYKKIDVVSESETHSSVLSKEYIKRQISTSPEVEKFVQRIIDANIHTITTSTSITLNTNGLFTTPLGLVTPDNINAARDILAKAALGGNIPQLTNEYLMLIPHNVGMKPDLTIIATQDKIKKENDILDALLSSWETAQNIPKEEKENVAPIFNITFNLINNTTEAERIANYFNNSKSKNHGDRLQSRVINVFELSLHNKPSVINADAIEVFHGTGQGNLLSIMKNGLMKSPPSAAAIAGKMFGNGIYGAINSTKSMGYTRQGSGQSGWMFICKFDMGKYYHPTRTISFPPTGYDSVWARKNDCGLYHDELIVYEDNRVEITHLLEFI